MEIDYRSSYTSPRIDDERLFAITARPLVMNRKLITASQPAKIATTDFECLHNTEFVNSSFPVLKGSTVITEFKIQDLR
jgi:hypothetical protein